jgi:ribosome-binding factor A
MSNRPERVAQLMRREIAEIIMRRLSDPRMTAMVSVTDVEVTHDLSSAKVFVGVMPDGPEREKTLEALHSAAGFVRHELAPRLGLREVPQIRFVLDTSMERGARVDDLLRRIGRGEPIDDEDKPE